MDETNGNNPETDTSAGEVNSIFLNLESLEKVTSQINQDPVKECLNIKEDKSTTLDDDCILSTKIKSESDDLTEGQSDATFHSDLSIVLSSCETEYFSTGTASVTKELDTDTRENSNLSDELDKEMKTNSEIESDGGVDLYQNQLVSRTNAALDLQQESFSFKTVESDFVEASMNSPALNTDILKGNVDYQVKFHSDIKLDSAVNKYDSLDTQLESTSVADFQPSLDSMNGTEFKFRSQDFGTERFSQSSNLVNSKKSFNDDEQAFDYGDFENGMDDLEFADDNEEFDGSNRSTRTRRKVVSMTKVAIRRLPPTMTEIEFLESVSPIPDYNYIHFCTPDKAYGPNGRANARINFINEDDAHWFVDRFNNYMFLDVKGNEYFAVCNLAPNPLIPKARKKDSTIDASEGTLEETQRFQDFLEVYEESPMSFVGIISNEDITPEMMVDEIELKILKKGEQESTPLLDYIRDKIVAQQEVKPSPREQVALGEIAKRSMDKFRTIKKASPTFSVINSQQTLYDPLLFFPHENGNANPKNFSHRLRNDNIFENPKESEKKSELNILNDSDFVPLSSEAYSSVKKPAIMNNGARIWSSVVSSSSRGRNGTGCTNYGQSHDPNNSNQHHSSSYFNYSEDSLFQSTVSSSAPVSLESTKNSSLFSQSYLAEQSHSCSSSDMGLTKEKRRERRERERKEKREREKEVKGKKYSKEKGLKSSELGDSSVKRKLDVSIKKADRPNKSDIDVSPKSTFKKGSAEESSPKEMKSRQPQDEEQDTGGGGSKLKSEEDENQKPPAVERRHFSSGGYRDRVEKDKSRSSKGRTGSDRSHGDKLYKTSYQSEKFSKTSSEKVSKASNSEKVVKTSPEKTLRTPVTSEKVSNATTSFEKEKFEQSSSRLPPKKKIIKKIIKVKKVRSTAEEDCKGGEDCGSTKGAPGISGEGATIKPKKIVTVKKVIASSSSKSEIDKSKDKDVRRSEKDKEKTGEQKSSGNTATSSASVHTEEKDKDKEKRVRKGRPDLQIYRPGSLRSATSASKSSDSGNTNSSTKKD